MTKHMILAQLSLFLVGCAAVGPSYKSPDLALSPDFHGGGGQERSDTVRTYKEGQGNTQLDLERIG